MSSTDFMFGFDPTDTADSATSREFVPFDGNVATCSAGEVYTFENSGDSILRFRHRVEEGPNKGMQATLQYPTAPKLTKRVGDTYSDQLTDEEKAAAIKGWQRGLARIIVAYKLPTPAAVTGEWAAGAEGAQVVLKGAYTDRKGYGSVTAFQNQQRKDYKGDKPFEYAIGLVGAEEPAKDRKGPIPGLTALEQARQQIQKWEQKQS